MAPRYFTVQEANDLLTELRPLMAELLERRARVVHMRHQLQDVVGPKSDTGSPAASAAVQEFIIIEELVEQIRAYGCELKDINAGLLDFLAQHNGREVFLCWRYGEPQITHYHDLTAGFNGRRPL
ncbi:MAG TPA: DUF2203 domain-containing protein [Anaerolineae bacterium]|nr:DUF2203 domain-containing protein [Anaerolineae bacterium]